MTDDQISVSEIAVNAKPIEESEPLIFINACFGGRMTDIVYRNFTFANAFLDCGAGCVIGPQIEVPTVFAMEYAKRFFDRFLKSTYPAPKVGPLIRELNREFWHKKNPLGLIYSLHAGAGCHIQWNR